jgi:cysteine desulfurase
VIYLDHAASTPLRPEVRAAMEPYLGEAYGNPSGVHQLARAARRAVDEARDQLAAVFACEPAEVIFTSGGTEADNLAVTGSAMSALSSGAPRATVCCSAVEHPAVLEPVRFLGGIEVPVDELGVVDLGALEAVLLVERPDIVLVSVMLANNETGVIEPVAEVAELVRRTAPEAIVHTDAVQGLRYLDVATATAAVDLVSATAHKIGGPKGAGVLVARRGARSKIAPILRGGPQEHELRAGTPNVAAIVGFAAAAGLAVAEREAAVAHVAVLAARLLAGVRAVVPDARLSSEGAPKLDSIVNAALPGMAAEELLILLDQFGVAASAGSACASGALEPSPVLVAMGESTAEAKTHVRLSLGPTTSEADIDAALEALAEAVGRLRA